MTNAAGNNTFPDSVKSQVYKAENYVLNSHNNIP